MEIGKIEKVSKKVAKAAGKEILKIYNQDHDVSYKSDNSPLTKADLKSNEIIVNELKQFNIPILTEEEKDDLSRLNSDLVFIIDPLDGTKEFIKKNGEFTVNIGLVKNSKPILGVIYAPVLDELYVGHSGSSYLVKNNKKTKLSVSEVSKISEMSLVKSRSHSSKRMNELSKKFKESTSKGSSLKGCLVASGNSDCYIRLGPINEWDICAMHAIIENADGKVTKLNGKDIKFNQKNTLIKGFICSNDKIHDKLVSIVV